jgi:CheY-like chemotaxis protein
LTLAGQVITRLERLPDGGSGWQQQLGRLHFQQRLDAAAHTARRLAHDYSNLLTSILGFSELLLSQMPADGPCTPIVQTIRAAAEEGARLTSQLRLYGRRTWRVNSPARLAPALSDEERRLRRQFGPELCIKVTIPDDLPLLGIDPEPLRLLLAPLLDNAAEAVEGRGIVMVTARPVCLTALQSGELWGMVQPGAHVEIAIEDSGPALPHEVRQRLFREPFFTTKPRRRGLGLGVAYGLALSHRGGLAVEARLEGGVRVRLYLPVAGLPDTPAPEAPAATPGKVLVVDDDPMILHFVMATLQQAGYRVQTAASGPEALDRYTAADGEPFSLVLSDVVMPHVNGLDLARQLREQDASVNVLFMSGQTPEQLTAAERDGNPFDILIKPFCPDSLIRAVRTALERRPTVGAGRPPGRAEKSALSTPGKPS